MKKITNEDRVDQVFMDGTLDDARLLLTRATQIVRIRGLLSDPNNHERTARKQRSDAGKSLVPSTPHSEGK